MLFRSLPNLIPKPLFFPYRGMLNSYHSVQTQGHVIGSFNCKTLGFVLFPGKFISCLCVTKVDAQNIILCGGRATIFFRPAPTYIVKKFIQTLCVLYVNSPMKRSDMCSRNAPWPETFGQWLQDSCRSVELWRRIFTTWPVSWRIGLQGRIWRLGRRWLGPSRMPEIGSVLRKNNLSQRTFSRPPQL